jgi:hypothetical protein
MNRFALCLYFGNNKHIDEDEWKMPVLWAVQRLSRRRDARSVVSVALKGFRLSI